MFLLFHYGPLNVLLNFSKVVFETLDATTEARQLLDENI